jgi:hypothetical protein
MEAFPSSLKALWYPIILQGLIRILELGYLFKIQKYHE